MAPAEGVPEILNAGTGPGFFAINLALAVRSVTGVDNVCERAAAAGGGMLLAGKRAWEGVTVAIALENPAGDFPEPGESERETG